MSKKRTVRIVLAAIALVIIGVVVSEKFFIEVPQAVEQKVKTSAPQAKKSSQKKTAEKESSTESSQSVAESVQSSAVASSETTNDSTNESNSSSTAPAEAAPVTESQAPQQPEQTAAVATEQATSVTTYQSDGSIAGEVIALVNQYRQQQGLGSLAYDGNLAAGANSRVSQEIMAIQQTGDNNAADHYLPNGQPFSSEGNIRNYGAGLFGENLAVANGQGSNTATAQHLVTLWKNSPSHNQAMLNGRYTSTGVAVVALGNGKYVAIQEFAGR